MSSTAASESQHAVSLEDLPPPPTLRGPGQRVQNSGLSAPSSTPARSCDRPSTPRSLFVADRSDSVTDTSSEPVAADLSPDAVTSEPKAQSVTPITPTSTRIIAPTSAESLPAKEEVTKKKGRRKGTGISKVYWSEKDTAVLLEIYGSHKYQKMFLGGKVSNKVIWTEIAREVIERTGLAGIDYKTCWDKQKYLKKKYKEAKKSVTSGFGGEVTLSCPHFDEMDKLFSEELRIQLLLLSLRLLSWKRRRRSSTLQQFQ